MNFLQISLRLSTIVITMLAGAVVFSAGRSFGQDHVSGVEIPSNAVVAFTGTCPHGWTRYADGVGRVLVGAATPQEFRTQGGNSTLIANGGVSLAPNNIPRLTSPVTLSATSSTSVGQMAASSSDVGGFLGHTNPDVFFYGRATYAPGWPHENVSTSVSASASDVTVGSGCRHACADILVSDVTVGSDHPDVVPTVMPYVRLNFCRAL